MCVLILKTQTSTRVIACLFFSTNHKWIHQWSLHVCSFHTPHMDQPDSLHVCSFPQTTYGSTSGHCMCVLFHKPHMDQPVVIACVFFPQTTYGSTRVIACVFFP